MEQKITASIVAYNNYENICNALASMEEQTTPNLSKKIYIVDNGAGISDPKDVEDFKAFIEKYADVEYLDAGENLGFGKGHNKTIPLMRGAYHAIVNPDILFCEDAFMKIVEWMDHHPEAGMVVPYVTDEKGNKQEIYRRELTVFDMFNRMFLHELFRRRARKHTMQDMDFTKSFQVPFAQGSFLVARSKLLIQLGGFDEHFFMYVEDADLCKRVNQVSKLMYYPGARVIHKWQAGSHKNGTLFKYHVKSAIYYFQKWGLKFL